MKDKLNEITEYLIEDAHACMVDTEAGEPGAEADFFRALQRLQLFADSVANLSIHELGGDDE